MYLLGRIHRQPDESSIRKVFIRGLSRDVQTYVRNTVVPISERTLNQAYTLAEGFLQTAEILNTSWKAGKRTVNLIQDLEIGLDEPNEHEFDRSSEVFLVNHFPVDQRSKARDFLRNLRQDNAVLGSRRENDSHAQVEDEKTYDHQMCGICHRRHPLP